VFPPRKAIQLKPVAVRTNERGDCTDAGD